MPQKGKGWLRVSIEDFMETGPFPEFRRGIFQYVSEWLEGETAALVSPVLRKYISETDIPSDVKGVLLQGLKGKQQGGLVMVLGGAVGLVIGTITGFTRPLARKSEYAMERKVQSARLDLTQALGVAWRAPYLEQTMLDHLADLGYRDDVIQGVKETVRPRLGIVDLARLAFRFPEYKNLLELEMEGRGYGSGVVSDLLLALTQYAGPGDLVRFAVREVFSPELAEGLGLDVPAPPAYLDEMERAGFDRQQALWFWMAHWDLPSLRDGFEMLHRLRPEKGGETFTRDDLYTLMRAQDIAPHWHDKLAAIAYNTPRLTDARSMITKGVWGVEQLTEFFLDYGYDPDFVPALVELYTTPATDEGKDLTRAAIQKGYSQGLLNHDDAKSELMRIGYDEFEAEFWLTQVDADLAQDRIDDELDRIEFLYVNREIDENGAIDQMGKLNLTGQRTNELLSIWRIRRQTKILLPTKSELEDFYGIDIIDLGEYEAGLRALGYSDNRVGWLVEYTDQQLQQRRQDELTKEAEKAERVRQSEVRTSYNVEKARLDVEIATLRSTIADLKVARHSVEDETELAQYAVAIDALKAKIAELNVEKSELGRDLAEEIQGG